MSYKRNHDDSEGRLVRPPGWNDEASSSKRYEDDITNVSDDDDDKQPPARKILRRLLVNEVQRAVRDLNEEIPMASQTRSHRASTLIPEFDPDSDDCITVKAWIKKIEQLGDIHGWSDHIKAFYLQDKLKGQARKWYNRLDNYDYTWEDWKQMLMRAFPRQRDYGNMLEEMMNRRKLPAETMTRYYQDKVAMCFRCKLSDSATISCIIRGLPQSLQVNARAFQCDRPEELYEGFLSALDDYHPPSSNIRPPIKENGVKPIFDRKNISVNPDVDPCPRCKKTGHILRNCSQPDLRSCFKCGKQGHIATRCSTNTNLISSNDKVKEIKEIKLLQNYNETYEKLVKINGTHIKAYLDTGSQVNVLSNHVCKLLNMEVTPTETMLKGFSGNNSSSCGIVAFQMEIDGMTLDCKAHLTDIDMGGVHLLVGQPIINSENMILVVSSGVATLKQDNDFTRQMDIIVDTNHFKVVTTCKECLMPGTSIIKVNVVNNEEGKDVVTKPQHYELEEVSYSIPATLLRGPTGYIKVINASSHKIIWQQGKVLTRADSCHAQPPASVQKCPRNIPEDRFHQGHYNSGTVIFLGSLLLTVLVLLIGWALYKFSCNCGGKRHELELSKRPGHQVKPLPFNYEDYPEFSTMPMSPYSQQYTTMPVFVQLYEQAMMPATLKTKTPDLNSRPKEVDYPINEGYLAVDKSDVNLQMRSSKQVTGSSRSTHCLTDESTLSLNLEEQNRTHKSSTDRVEDNLICSKTEVFQSSLSLE